MLILSFIGVAGAVALWQAEHPVLAVLFGFLFVGGLGWQVFWVLVCLPFRRGDWRRLGELETELRLRGFVGDPPAQLAREFLQAKGQSAADFLNQLVQPLAPVVEQLVQPPTTASALEPASATGTAERCR